MDAFIRAWTLTGRLEGGYVDNPYDSGGATNWGITEAVARKRGYTGHMRDLPRTLALKIAKEEYWDVLYLDEIAKISEDIAFEVFDTGFNCGTHRAAEFLQRALNVLNRQSKHYADIRVDGAIGAKTAAALAAYIAVRGKKGVQVLLKVLNCLQGNHYVTLAERREKDEEFVFGWFDHRISI